MNYNYILTLIYKGAVLRFLQDGPFINQSEQGGGSSQGRDVGGLRPPGRALLGPRQALPAGHRGPANCPSLLNKSKDKKVSFCAARGVCGRYRPQAEPCSAWAGFARQTPRAAQYEPLTAKVTLSTAKNLLLLFKCHYTLT